LKNNFEVVKEKKNTVGEKLGQLMNQEHDKISKAVEIKP
jgi:hypothetical protein